MSYLKSSPVWESADSGGLLQAVVVQPLKDYRRLFVFHTMEVGKVYATTSHTNGDQNGGWFFVTAISLHLLNQTNSWI